ncbi:MAG: hemolysin III family protein [Methylobacteriaceae bacterium]|nr:hemolysin III family protein [Methylobacteriaceae bacterium]
MTLPADHPRLWKRDYSHGELIADGAVHAIAILAGLIAFAALFARLAQIGDWSSGVAAAIYAASFFLMFGFSCAYNMTPPSHLKWLLRRLDHSAIYIMIAGTYTAALAQVKDAAWGWTLIAVVWAGALAGAILKLALPGRYDRLAVLAYLLLGWVGVLALGPLLDALPRPTLTLLLVGGLVYSLGVIFYKWHALKFQNAIWHACVALAAFLQFAGIAYAMWS